ncbi:protein trachealess-like isoform X3 [Panonychus citri]|uniref:protein trachealess-like isoform X3 n=1 Tax=Panonychus citri TaxID=50023 RepID=UPI002307BE22|nr:protein trachealess-like isoform X3 [Panonychus citri]
MDSHHFNPYHHPYYRVGTGVKDHPHHHHHQSVETAAQAAIVQSRILEMRKEKSRDAARSRRGKENHEFYELAKLLPLPAAITSQLDKASIIRLTISYLKLRDFANNGEPNWAAIPINQNNNPLKSSKMYNMFDVHQGTHILQSLDGFAFALGSDGRFLYISETVSIYLGLSQVEMTGSSIFDYTHQQDHTELAEQLGLTHTSSSSSSSSSHLSSSPLPPASVASNASSNESDSPTSYSNSVNNVMTTANYDHLERQFCIRMKSTLTKRGCQHFKSSGYRVVHVISHLRPDFNARRDSQNGPVKLVGLVAVAIALPPPSVNELRLEPDMFVMRLGLDFKILHCEPRISDLLDYNADQLTGRNMYSLVHGEDVIQLRKCHLDLIHKGQVMSKYYKIMNKNGGFTWIQTCATLICNNSGTTNGKGPTNNGPTNGGGTEDQEQSIISVNYVISGVEYDNVIMDSSQLGGGIGLVNSVSSSPITIKTSPSSKRITPSPPSPLTTAVGSQPQPSSTPSSVSSSSPSATINQSNQLSSSNGSNGLIGTGIRRPLTSDSCSSQQQHQQQQQQQQHGLSNGNSPGHHGIVANNNNSSSSSNLNIMGNSSIDCSKRRRYTSSPVRPWKSPSPPSSESPGVGVTVGSNGLANIVGGHNLMSSPSSPGACGSPASNLLRHISVIRETPAILKPQVVAPTAAYHAHHIPHHTHPNPHHTHQHHQHTHPHVHPHSHAYHQSPPPPISSQQQQQPPPPPHPPSHSTHPHYHHLVDPYTAAYHIYKTGGNHGGPGVSQTATVTPGQVVTGNNHHLHWGAYN